MQTIMCQRDRALRLMLLAAFAMYLSSCGSTRYSGSILNLQRPVPPPPAADSVKVQYHFAGGTEAKPGRMEIEWKADSLGRFQITKKQLEAMIHPAKYSRRDHLTVSYERPYESQLIVHWYSLGEDADSSQSFPIEYAHLVSMDCDAMQRYAPNVPTGTKVQFEKSWNALKGSANLAFDTKAKAINFSLVADPNRTLYPCKDICHNPMDRDSIP